MRGNSEAHNQIKFPERDESDVTLNLIRRYAGHCYALKPLGISEAYPAKTVTRTYHRVVKNRRMSEF